MATSKKNVIVAYIGIDGACAAAAASLKHPRAEILVSSAQRIGRTLGELARRRGKLGEIHVCGLGVHGDWGEVAEQAERLRKKGVKILWHCGRGYLEADQYQEICTPVFLDAASNTEGICRHFQLEKHPHAQVLMNLALHDTWIQGTRKRPPRVDQRWLDLIDASRAEYFKFSDQDRYVETIRKLARQEFDAADERAVKIFGRSGMRYVLEGRSPQMKRLRKLIRQCAAADAPVLIGGESGTGKELVANLIHERSRRATEPLVAINCALFAGNVGLANSVLFGHVKGAFTGAVAERRGAFLEASGGTLFLDELGELPLEVQAKLLRALEEQVVTPEGSDQAETSVDVMVIAATNRDLPAMIRRGEFRADLFHRLSTLRITLPPLRDRPEDLNAIVAKTLGQLAEQGFKRRLSKEDERCLLEYHWPGNIRQLIKIVQRAVYLDMPVAEVIEEERQLGSLEPPTEPPEVVLPKTVEEIRPLDEIRNAYARHALKLYHGNVHAAARALQVTDRTLQARLSDKPDGRRARHQR